MEAKNEQNGPAKSNRWLIPKKHKNSLLQLTESIVIHKSYSNHLILQVR